MTQEAPWDGGEVGDLRWGRQGKASSAGAGTEPPSAPASGALGAAERHTARHLEWSLQLGGGEAEVFIHPRVEGGPRPVGKCGL